MSSVPNTTRAQTSFLRAFRQNPSGPQPEDWPSPAILRRWLRKSGFKSALHELQKSLRFQTDFLIQSAAASAARSLDDPHSPAIAKHIAQVLRLSHLRARFDDSLPNLLPQSGEEPEPKTAPPPVPPPILPPEKRLTEAEFKKLAWQKSYCRPLEKCSHFPQPVPQDTFYFHLLQDPSALLWWLKLYDEQSGDRRYNHILHQIRHLIPREYPESPLPRFSKSLSPADPSPLIGPPHP